MIWLVVKVLMYVLLGIVLLYAMRELRSYLNLAHFKKQGIKSFYWPFIGVASQFIPDPNDTDELKKMAGFIEAVQKEPLVVFNNHWKTNPAALLLDPDLIKEFFVKEVDYFTRSEPLPDSNLGWFYHQSKNVNANRASYSKLFNFDNMRIFTQMTSEITDRIFRKYKEDNLKTPDAKHKLRIGDLLGKVVTEVVTSVMYGEDSGRLIEGKALPMTIEKNVNAWGAFAMNPLNILSYGFLYGMGLLPGVEVTEKHSRKLSYCAGISTLKD